MKKNMTYDEVIKAETILNLSNELLKTTVLNMKQYSDDPTAHSITNAAVYLFIKDMDKIVNPDFAKVLNELLTKYLQQKTNGNIK